MNQTEKLRTLIRESINEYIREIEEGGNIAALEAKELKCEEAIQMRQERLNKINENDDLKEMVDENKMKEIQNEIKLLEKAKKKYAAQKAKMQAKKDKKENPKKEEEVTTDTPIDEADVTAQMEMSDDKMKEEALNESFLKMQKLAGVITEGQYRKKLQMLNELEAKDVKKGETYMYKWSDKYAPIKVKILGGSSWGDDTFTVEALEDKDGLKQGNQYNAKAEALSPMSVGE